MGNVKKTSKEIRTLLPYGFTLITYKKSKEKIYKNNLLIITFYMRYEK